jgi:hypothetical protein
MTTLINRHFFKHATTKTVGFNNLCNIIHKIETEGVYQGQVYLGQTLLGSFSLKSDSSISSTQVQIDVSSFDSVSHVNLTGKVQTNPSYAIGKSGFLVIFASGPQDGFYVTLSTSDGKTTTIVFDTRKLDNGDIVIFRPVIPGMYVVSDDGGTHKIDDSVVKGPAGTNPATLKPVPVTFKPAGIEPNSVDVAPLQALVISFTAAASLSFS